MSTEKFCDWPKKFARARATHRALSVSRSPFQLMGVLFRKGRQPTQEEIDAVPPPTDDELWRTLTASAAGVLVMVAIRVGINRFDLLGPAAEGDQLGAELRKGVPVAGGLAVAYLVWKINLALTTPSSDAGGVAAPASATSEKKKVK